MCIYAISIPGCVENSHVNNLKGSQSVVVSGWTFDIETGPWNGGDFGDCKSKSWFGFSYLKNDGVASISTILHGTGKAILGFGNCWKNGNVTLYQNGVELKTVGKNTDAQVEFTFKDGDEIKITEKGYAILYFEEIHFIECSSGKKLF